MLSIYSEDLQMFYELNGHINKDQSPINIY